MALKWSGAKSASGEKRKCDGSPSMTGISAERSEGAQCRSEYGTDSEERASERFALDLARGALTVDCGGAVLGMVVLWWS